MLIWRRLPVRAGGFEDETEPAPHVDWHPDLDIYEGPAEFLLVFSLPGVDEDHVEVTVIGRTLTVSGRRLLSLPEGVIAHLLESRRGDFLRRVRLAAATDLTAVRTRLSHGQLLVNVPKMTSATIRIDIVS